jgi:hypothetical protein
MEKNQKFNVEDLMAIGKRMDRVAKHATEFNGDENDESNVVNTYIYLMKVAKEDVPKLLDILGNYEGIYPELIVEPDLSNQ